MTYDAENVRTAKVTGGVRTEYTTDRESTYSQVLVKKEYEKNVFGLYTEQKNATTYVYGTGLVSERRDGGEEFYYHYNHLGSTVAVSDKGGNVVYRIVYDTYGELSDIQNGNKVSLKTAEKASEYTLAELADAAGIEYLYNGKYGVTTDSNGLYYMRARYYDQDIKRFINRDVLSGDITNSQSLNRYCYVQGNPVSLTDPFGLCPTAEEIRKIEISRAVHTTLDIIGILFDEADVLNIIVYAIEGDYVEAALSLFFSIPAVGSIIGLPFKYAFKLGGNAAEGLAKFTKKHAPELAESVGKLTRNAGGKLDDVGQWISKKFEKLFSKDSSKFVPTQEQMNDAVVQWATMEKSLAGSNRQLNKFKTATVVYDVGTGNYYYGMNRGLKLSGDSLNPSLASWLPEKSLNRLPLGNCAEVDAINQALNSGANINDLYMYTISVKTNVPKPMCENCVYTFADKVADVFSN